MAVPHPWPGKRPKPLTCQSVALGGLTMSDEAHWAAAVTAKADDNPFAPFTTGDDDATVADTNNMGATQTLAAGFANSLAGAAALAVVARAIPITETAVSTIAKAEAETGTADFETDTVVCAGGAGCCGQGAQSDGAGDEE